jgi:hypothetical protein
VILLLLATRFPPPNPALMHEDAEPPVVPDIVTRSDAPGRWSSAVPLLMLALLGLMVLHSCVPR